MNVVTLIGRLGMEPELKHTTNGKAVVRLRLAVDAGKDKTDWLTVIAWEKQAEAVAAHLHKGAQVGVEGRLSVREWQRDDGSRAETVEVVAFRVHFLGGRGDAEGQGASARAAVRPAAQDDEDEDPFSDEE